MAEQSPVHGCDGLEEGTKHLKAARRANRFDPERKFGAVHGRTVAQRDKRVEWIENEKIGPDMIVERPESNEGVVLSRLDLEASDRPELATETPVRNGVAEELCKVLEELCVASSIRRHPENPNFALRVFELPVAGVRRAEGTTDRNKPVPLFAAPAKQVWDAEPTTYTTLALGPPEEVLEQSLMPRAKLRWSGCAELPKAFHPERGNVRPSCAAVGYPVNGRVDHKQRQKHSLSSRNCWVQDSPESYLEVDLGDNCNVTHVSTMGRFPPMTEYPSNEQLRTWLEESPELSRDRVRTWSVVWPSGQGWEQWVTRYDLQARADGGKQWLSVGTFKGNADMTSEVAHDLREVCHAPDGLQCRFLRFIPQGHHGRPAMRVGVYGTSPGKDSAASKGEQVEEQRVRYLVPFPLNNRNIRRRQRVFGNNDNWTVADRRRQRHMLQRTTRIETREATNGEEGEQEPKYDDDEPPGGAQVEHRWQPPQLQRAISQRMEEALNGPAPLLRTITDDARGYCSDPEELEVESQSRQQAEAGVPPEQQQQPPQQPALLRSRTDEHRGYCSEPEEPLVADADDSEWTLI